MKPEREAMGPLKVGISCFWPVWAGFFYVDCRHMVGLTRGRRWCRLAGLLLIPPSVLMATWLLLVRASGWFSDRRGGAVRPIAQTFGARGCDVALAIDSGPSRCDVLRC